MTKILYVISTPIEYSSSANMRNIALIKGLIENNYSVDLLSDGYDSNSKYVDSSLCRINFRKRYYLRKFDNTALSIDKKGSIINKLISKFKIYASKFLKVFSVYDSRKVLVKKVRKIKFEDSYDLIISSSDPKSSHLIAKELIKTHPTITKKWFQYWGDPFLIDINNSRNIFTKHRIKKEEFKILSQADKIIYVSPFTLDYQKKIYPALKDKMCFEPIPYYEKKIYKNIETNSVGYFGDYNSKDRNILNLYNCCLKNNFNLTIMGNSDLKLDDKCQNIKVLSRQSKQIMEQYEKEVKLLVCICNKNGTQIPGKVYHYAATNKPILIILDGEYKDELKKYFKKFKRYYICDNKEESIKKMILHIFDDDNQKFLPIEKIYCKTIAKNIVNK